MSRRSELRARETRCLSVGTVFWECGRSVPENLGWKSWVQMSSIETPSQNAYILLRMTLMSLPKWMLILDGCRESSFSLVREQNSKLQDYLDTTTLTRHVVPHLRASLIKPSPLTSVYTHRDFSRSPKSTLLTLKGTCNLASYARAYTSLLPTTCRLRHLRRFQKSSHCGKASQGTAQCPIG